MPHRSPSLVGTWTQPRFLSHVAILQSSAAELQSTESPTVHSARPNTSTHFDDPGVKQRLASQLRRMQGSGLLGVDVGVEDEVGVELSEDVAVEVYVKLLVDDGLVVPEVVV